MFLNLIIVIASLVVLVLAADKFVDGAASIAKHFNASSLLIGILVVGLGTSAPELAVSVLASLNNNSQISLGNAYGSNIANIALILGITAILKPIFVKQESLKEFLGLSIVSIIAAIQLIDNNISRFEGFILLICFGFAMAFSIFNSKEEDGEEELEEHTNLSFKTALIYLVVGLIALILSSKFLVFGSVNIAKALGVSDLIIGLTIVAVGTSLPELAASITSALKNQTDMVLGNIIGSNLFNTSAVVGLAALINPFVADKEIFQRDVVFTLFLTFALFLISKFNIINRTTGICLVASYCLYIIYLIA